MDSSTDFTFAVLVLFVVGLFIVILILIDKNKLKGKTKADEFYLLTMFSLILMGANSIASMYFDIYASLPDSIAVFLLLAPLIPIFGFFIVGIKLSLRPKI